jgi:hypothetical protein
LDVKWRLENYGPGFEGYKELLNSIESINSFSKDYLPNQKVLDIIDFTYEKSERLKYTELTNLTFSTYPITTEKYENINLEEKAIEYKKILNKKE